MSLSIYKKRVGILALSVAFASIIFVPALVGANNNANNANSGDKTDQGAEHCEEHKSSDIALPKVESATGNKTVSEVNFEWSGDPGVLTVTNNNATTATIEWCAKGGAKPNSPDGKFYEGSMITGKISTVLGAGKSVKVNFGTEVSYFLVYSVVIADPEPEMYYFEFDKVWEGDVDQVDLSALEVSFVADSDFEWTLGVDAAVEVSPGETTLTNVAEVVTGLPGECTSTATSAVGEFPLATLTAPANEDGAYSVGNTFTLMVTNTIECDDESETPRVPEVPEAPVEADVPEEGEVLADTDEREEKEDEGEILAATTVRSLPETGSSASIVAGVAAIFATVLAMASTAIKGAFVRFTV